MFHSPHVCSLVEDLHYHALRSLQLFTITSYYISDYQLLQRTLTPFTTKPYYHHLLSSLTIISYYSLVSFFSLRLHDEDPSSSLTITTYYHLLLSPLTIILTIISYCHHLLLPSLTITSYYHLLLASYYHLLLPYLTITSYYHLLSSSLNITYSFQNLTSCLSAGPMFSHLFVS
jgi:hypothetical protein